MGIIIVIIALTLYFYLSKMKNKLFLNSLIILSFLSLSFAYFVEFVLGHEPCNLCKIERIPYIGAIILGSLIILLINGKKLF